VVKNEVRKEKEEKKKEELTWPYKDRLSTPMQCFKHGDPYNEWWNKKLKEITVLFISLRNP
jgi:hypothetical protein